MRPACSLFPSQTNLVFSWEIWLNAQQDGLVLWEEKFVNSERVQASVPHAVPKEEDSMDQSWGKSTADTGREMDGPE